MIPKQLRAFVSKLAKSTDNGELKWSARHDSLQSSFFCKRKDFEVAVAKYWSDEEERSYITLSIDPPTGEPARFSVSNYDDDYLDMRALYELASISAADISESSLDKFFTDV